MLMTIDGGDVETDGGSGGGPENFSFPRTPLA